MGNASGTKTEEDYSFEDPTPRKSANPDNVGSDIKNFGEQVASRVDRIIKKKGFDWFGDPWLFQGIPIVFPSPSVGFNLGLKVQLQNIRRQDPHKLEIEAQVLASDSGRYKHSLAVDYPRAFGGLYRVSGRIAYDRDISFRYFGIGNNPPIIESALANDQSPLYANTREGPGVALQALRYLGHHFRAGPVLTLKWTTISFPAGSLLDQQRPSGVNGGRTHNIGIAFVHDTLDFEPYPARGAFHELYMRYYGKYIGSDYEFGRFTYTYRQYYQLHRRLIFASRLLLEYLEGDIPFFELGAVGGSNSNLVFGGDRYIRGYEGNRFLDKFRFVYGIELRWDAIEFGFAKQDITIGFVPFVETGRFWPTLVPSPMNVFHASMGWGARIIWNNRFILRGDVAISTEGVGLAVNLGNSF